MSIRLLIAAVIFSQAAGAAIDVSHVTCPTTPVRIADHDQVEIRGACNAERTALHVSVRNLAAREVGPLQLFNLGFCQQSVADATAPPGWVVSVYGEPRQTVEWRVADSSHSEGIATGQLAEGFSVVLKSGWLRSRSSSAAWVDTGSGLLTTHDCP